MLWVEMPQVGLLLVTGEGTWGQAHLDGYFPTVFKAHAYVAKHTVLSLMVLELLHKVNFVLNKCVKVKLLG